MALVQKRTSLPITPLNISNLGGGKLHEEVHWQFGIPPNNNAIIMDSTHFKFTIALYPDEHTNLWSFSIHLLNLPLLQIQNNPSLSVHQLIDRLDYDDKSFVLNEEDVISRINNEAEILLRLNH